MLYKAIQLQITQDMNNGVNPGLMKDEKEALGNLQKLSNLQEKMFKQKSKAHWLSVGDGNNI